jgi:hypothetical protein
LLSGTIRAAPETRQKTGIGKPDLQKCGWAFCFYGFNMNPEDTEQENETVERIMSGAATWNDVREFMGPELCRSASRWEKEDFDRLISNFMSDCPAKRCWEHLRDAVK